MGQKIDVQMNSYVPPSRLTMDSNEVLSSPNFNQAKTRVEGTATPPIMNQNFMADPAQDGSTQYQKQLLIEQLKHELN